LLCTCLKVWYEKVQWTIEGEREKGINGTPSLVTYLLSQVCPKIGLSELHLFSTNHSLNPNSLHMHICIMYLRRNMHPWVFQKFLLRPLTIVISKLVLIIGGSLGLLSQKTTADWLNIYFSRLCHHQEIQSTVSRQ
jgi:hypothetical protein